MFNKKQLTVDGIMTAFNKTITDLETVKANNIQIAANLEEQRDELDLQINEAIVESSRAGKIATQLTKLVN